MLGNGHRAEDAGDRGRIDAEDLIGQPAARQAHGHRALGDRAKVLQPGEVGREAGFRPHRERRKLDEQLGDLGEVGDRDGPWIMAVAVPVAVIPLHLVLAVIRLLIVPRGAMVAVRLGVLRLVPMPGLVIVVMAQAKSVREVASGQEQGCCDQQYRAGGNAERRSVFRSRDRMDRS